MKSGRQSLGAVVATFVMLGGCGDFYDPGSVLDRSAQLVQRASVSGCGGFSAGTRAVTRQVSTYCEAEVLSFEYSAETELLELTDSRIELNCDGERSIVASRDGDVIVVAETDGPKDGQRGRCMCVFDMAIELEQIPAGSLSLRLVRDTTDDQLSSSTVFAGQIDLSTAAGSMVVDSTPSMWCQRQQLPLLKTEPCAGAPLSERKIV